MKFKRQFSADLYHARLASGLTQDEIAQAVGITLRTYQYIEKGETIPHGDTLLKLVYLLNLDIERYRAVLTAQSSE